MTFTNPDKTVIRKRKTQVVNHIFEQCVELVDEQFWKDVFSNLARAKYPSGVFYKDGVLFVKSSGKNLGGSFVIPIDNVEETSKQTVEILKTHARIYSAQNKQDRRAKFQQYQEEQNIQYTDWKKIRKRGIKDDLIAKFCHTKNVEFKWGGEKTRDVFEFIQRGLTLGHILPEDMILENGELVEIKNIDLDQEPDFTYDIDDVEEVLSSSPQTKQLIKKLSYSDLWKKKIHPDKIFTT